MAQKTGTELLELLEKQLAEDYDTASDASDAPAEQWKAYPLCGLTFGERDGCVNENSPVWRDDILLGIIEMFYSYYKVIRDQFEEDFKIKMPEWVRIVVQPDYDDTSYVVLFLSSGHKVLLSYDCKAWHFTWDTPEELAKSLQNDYNLMVNNFKA